MINKFSNTIAKIHHFGGGGCSYVPGMWRECWVETRTTLFVSRVDPDLFVRDIPTTADTETALVFLPLIGFYNLFVNSPYFDLEFFYCVVFILVGHWLEMLFHIYHCLWIKYFCLYNGHNDLEVDLTLYS